MIAILSALRDEIEILVRGVRTLEEGSSGETRYTINAFLDAILRHMDDPA